MPRELPIIFCSEMVKAILDGRKTQTRRIIPLEHHGFYKNAVLLPDGTYCFNGYGTADFKFCKPHYQVGDELWIRETWAADRPYDSFPPRTIPIASSLWFPDQLGWKRDKQMGKVRSPRFMPKWAARLWLRVKAILDPHRIQTISEEEAIAEGINATGCCRCSMDDYIEGVRFCGKCNKPFLGLDIEFGSLWNRLHPTPGERFEDSPWVFPYVFERFEK